VGCGELYWLLKGGFFSYAEGGIRYEVEFCSRRILRCRRGFACEHIQNKLYEHIGDRGVCGIDWSPAFEFGWICGERIGEVYVGRFFFTRVRLRLSGWCVYGSGGDAGGVVPGWRCVGAAFRY